MANLSFANQIEICPKDIPSEAITYPKDGEQRKPSMQMAADGIFNNLYQKPPI